MMNGTKHCVYPREKLNNENYSVLFLKKFFSQILHTFSFYVKCSFHFLCKQFVVVYDWYKIKLHKILGRFYHKRTILQMSYMLQVSFDVAWSADGIDGRFYEYKAIANYSDLIFIMAYDEQSQILEGPCTAR